MMLIFVTTSCDKIADGAYSPKTKINKMYYENLDGRYTVTRDDGLGLEYFEYE